MAVAENGLNKDDVEVSALYCLSTKSIERLRKRCCQKGLPVALAGKKREAFKEKKLTGEVQAKLSMMACSTPPSGYARRILQLLADKMAAQSYIRGRAVKKMNLNLAREDVGDTSSFSGVCLPDGASPGCLSVPLCSALPGSLPG